MAEEKTRRQLNLVICLLATRRYLSAREIRATVQGYERAESDDAFKRMFERDKDELRSSGVPVEVGDVDVWGDEQGYRIRRDAYELPPLELRADEAGVLALAARAWRFAALGDAASQALLKLRAAGVPLDDALGGAPIPVLGTEEPAFLPVWQAFRDRRAISFDYRAPGRPVVRRTLEPWGVVNRRGRWYVVGFDRDRAAPRVFRLSRIVGDVAVDRRGPAVEIPPDADVRDLVRLERRRESREVATLLVRSGAAYELRRGAQEVVPEAGGEWPGWETLRYPYFDVATLAPLVAEFGDRVVVVRPEELREAVLAHLRAVAERPLPAPEEGVQPGDREERRPEQPHRPRSPSSERLHRLLTLVPYALNRGDLEVSEVARQFGLSERQVLKDLNLLWTCGLPGYSPGDLIDVDMDAATTTGEIIISNADTLEAPLRLTADQAVSLLVGLRLLGELPDVAESDALNRVGEKLRRAAGAAVRDIAASVDVRVELTDEVKQTQRRATVALRDQRRVHIRYHSYYRDAITERDVDPMRVVLVEGYPYLEGWCRLTEGMRLFRLDRVLDFEILPVAAKVPAHARPRELSDGAVQFSADDAYITVWLAPSERWVTEDYVCSAVRELEGGELIATLRTPDPAWVRRLVLRLGPSGRVLAPVEFAGQVAEDARRALARYEEYERHEEVAGGVPAR